MVGHSSGVPEGLDGFEALKGESNHGMGWGWPEWKEKGRTMFMVIYEAVVLPGELRSRAGPG